MQNVLTKTADNEAQLFIDLDSKGYTVNNAKVESITMNVTVEENGEVYAGDLAVNWEAVDDSNYDDGNSTLLMRNIHDENANTQTMSAFYWDGEFTETLQSILKTNGFSENAVTDVCTSEWGMQDVGRASYDAYTLAEEILQHLNIAYEKDVA